MPRNKMDSLEALQDLVQRAVWRTFDKWEEEEGERFDSYVVHTFDDAVIIQDMISDKLYEATYVISGGDVIFGELQEVEEVYVKKRFEDAGVSLETSLKRGKASDRPEIGGPIVNKNAAKRIAHAAVLVPGEPDSDGEVLTAEKIEEVAHEWMEAYRNVDLMHTLNNVGSPVESYLLPQDMQVTAYDEEITLPKGTWVLASKFSPETWGRIESEELTGYSVMGIKRTALENASTKSVEGNALDQTAFKRTLLEDLGPDWIAAFVSVVDEPAVPKAKFFALKASEGSEAEEQEECSPTFFARLKGALGISHEGAKKSEEDSRLDEETFEELKGAVKQLSNIIESTEKDQSEKHEEEEGEDLDTNALKELIAGSMKEALEPIEERLSKVEKSEQEQEQEQENTEENASEKSEQKPAGEDISASEEGSAGAEKKDDSASEEGSAEVEDEDISEEVYKRIDELEKRVRRLSTSSKALPQDGEGEKVAKKNADRDAFGRKVRTK